jgi:hypothetical protein
MSRPFETREGAAERKPSHFERGLFHARNIDELAMEFLNPEIDLEKLKKIERIVRRVSSADADSATEKELVEQASEVLSVEDLLPENFFYSGERKFCTIYGFKIDVGALESAEYGASYTKGFLS